MTEIKLIIFDLSGTTVDDHHAVAKILHQVVKDFKLDVSLEELHKITGTNAVRLFEYLIARSRGRELCLEEFDKYDFTDTFEEAMSIYKRYREILINYYQNHVKAMSGAEDIFRWCREHDISIAMDTGFDRDINNAIIEGLKWKERNLIDLVVDVENTYGVGKPSPFMIFYAMEKLGIQNEHQVIKVGDTPSDLLSGLNAGCKGNIGVLTGACSREILTRYRHTHIISGVCDLPRLIEKDYKLFDYITA